MLHGVPDAARLFIESSTPRASLALLRGSSVLFEEDFAGDRSHNALLFSPLQRALGLLDPAEKLAAVVIGTGPGSYSGTRVGIAAGQGVAMVHGCPAVGLCSLLAVVSSRSLAVGDARRGSAWRVRIDPDSIPEDPALCHVDQLAAEIRASGDPVFSLEPVNRIGLPAGLAESIAIGHPTALRLAAAWQRLPAGEKSRLETMILQPVYLRPPHVTEAKPGHPLLRR